MYAYDFLFNNSLCQIFYVVNTHLVYLDSKNLKKKLFRPFSTEKYMNLYKKLLNKLLYLFLI